MRGAKYPAKRLQPAATSGLVSHLINVQAAASRSGELPFGRIRLAPPMGTALSRLRGRNAVRYGVFMFSRTKDSDPADRIIMPARPWKNAVVTALASVTPSGITLALCTSWSRNRTAPTVLGAV